MPVYWPCSRRRWLWPARFRRGVRPASTRYAPCDGSKFDTIACMRALVFFLPAAAFAAACTTTTDCTEWISYGSGPARSLIYRTYPLNVKNENIKRAFIMVHGAGRDADNYFRTAIAAAF